MNPTASGDDGYMDETAKFQLNLMKYVPIATIVVAALIFIAAFSAMNQPTEQLPAAPEPTLNVVSRQVPSPASGAPGSPTELIEERVEDEPSSALQEYRKKQREEARRAAKKAAKSGGKITNASAGQVAVAIPSAAPQKTGHYVLPLPPAGRFRSDQHKTGKTYVTGETRYSVAAPIGQVCKIYDLNELFKASYTQGLFPRSAMTGYKGERADGNVVSYEASLEVEGDKKVSIKLKLFPDDKNPSSATSIVVSYKLRRGQSVRLRREGL